MPARRRRFPRRCHRNDGRFRPWSGGLTCLRAGRLPIPRQQFVEFLGRMLGDAPKNVGQPGLRINIVHVGATIRLYITAARSQQRSEPQNNHDFRRHLQTDAANSSGGLA
jgi:hypothetical protein